MGCWGHMVEEGNIDVFVVYCRGVSVEDYGIYDRE